MGQSVLDHPLMGEHYAFLHRRQADGTLIAAGPLVDVDGDGLTIIEADSVEEARRLAEQDDESVRQEMLDVSVRPWRVVMAPIADQ